MMSAKRDHLIAVALDLFHRDGFHSVGIDRILTEAGVAKMTLYNHFPSKQDLILACLRRRDVQSRSWLKQCVEDRASEPYERLLVLFDAVAERCGSKEYPGCLFINACAEFADHDNPIHATAAEHKRLFTHYIYDLCQEAGFTEAGLLSQQLSILLDGVMARSSIAKNEQSGALARQIAAVLLEQAQREDASAERAPSCRS